MPWASYLVMALPVHANCGFQLCPPETNILGREKGESFPHLGKEAIGMEGRKALGLAEHSPPHEPWRFVSRWVSVAWEY